MITLTRTQYLEDLEQFHKTLVDIHPNPFTYISKEAFETELRELKKGQKYDAQSLGIQLQLILAKMRDTHTSVFFSDEIFGEQAFPMVLNYFLDGYYLTKCTEKYSYLLGKKLLEVNGMEIDECEKLLSKFIPKENSTSLNYYMPRNFTKPFLLKYLGIMEKDVIKLKFAEETTVDIESTKVLKLKNILDNTQSDVEETLIIKDIYSYKYFEKRDIFYFQYNSCEEMAEFPIVEVIKLLETVKPKKIIVDLRNNKGGDSDVLEVLIKYLQKNTANIQTIILVGRDTYSSAIINLTELSQIKGSFSVGEIPHGSPTHFGEVEWFTLKNSGLEIQTSSKLFEYKGYKLGDVFKPTYLVETSIEDYILGVDPQMRFVLEEHYRDGYQKN